jgi:non-ribosomal peptide synthetase component F
MTSRGAELHFALPETIAHRVKQVSLQSGTTVCMTLLAAFQILLGRYAGVRDVAVGMPVANRTRLETEHVIGCLVNTLVLRTRWTPDTSVRALLAQVRETMLEADAHQDLPFDLLVEALSPVRDAARSPLFQVEFNLLDAAPLASDVAGLQLTELPQAHQGAKVDLSLVVHRHADALSGVIIYNADLFTPATITRFGARFQRLLGAMVDDLEASVATVVSRIDGDAMSSLTAAFSNSQQALEV